MNRIIVALSEEIRMDETQEKSVIESDSKEKIGNTINLLDLLHRLFIIISATHPPLGASM
jgi:hypothetical protein